MRRSSSAIVSASSCTPAQSWRWSPVSAISGGAGERGRQAWVRRRRAHRLPDQLQPGASEVQQRRAMPERRRASCQCRRASSSNSRNRFASRYCGWASVVFDRGPFRASSAADRGPVDNLTRAPRRDAATTPGQVRSSPEHLLGEAGGNDRVTWRAPLPPPAQPGEPASDFAARPDLYRALRRQNGGPGIRENFE